MRSLLSRNSYLPKKLSTQEKALRKSLPIPGMFEITAIDTVKSVKASLLVSARRQERWVNCNICSSFAVLAIVVAMVLSALSSQYLSWMVPMTRSTSVHTRDACFSCLARAKAEPRALNASARLELSSMVPMMRSASAHWIHSRKSSLTTRN
jgi:hypothetical protein